MTVSSHSLALALKHLQAGQPRQAEQVCRQILQADPDHAGAWHLLGVVALQVGDYQAAADCISRAILSNPYDRKQTRGVSEADPSPEDRERLKQIPDPEPLVTFPEAIRTRRQAGGHAEASHRCATLLHLANIAIRCGRRIRYNPVKEEIVDDEEANRLVYRPMRAPCRL